MLWRTENEVKRKPKPWTNNLRSSTFSIFERDDCNGTSWVEIHLLNVATTRSFDIFKQHSQNVSTHVFRNTAHLDGFHLDGFHLDAVLVAFHITQPQKVEETYDKQSINRLDILQAHSNMP